jgi:acyl-CoA thioester hydrolase
MTTKEPIFRFNHSIRSRYCETDQMGYVYHGRYLEYFETTRTEFIRQAGFSYKSLEDSGVMMPVVNAKLNYHRPVLYDEVVTVSLLIYELPTARLHTFYEVTGPDGTLRVSGEVTLVFINLENRRPCRPPKAFIEGIQNYG